MMAVRLRPDHVVALLPHLGARDRAEILRVFPTLEKWAVSRFDLGAAWALVSGDEVIAIGGVVTGKDAEGVLWMAGREGWARRHIRHALRVFDVIKGFGGYAVLRCRCAVDNAVSRRFAERLGFEQIEGDSDFVTYGMAT